MNAITGIVDTIKQRHGDSFDNMKSMIKEHLEIIDKVKLIYAIFAVSVGIILSRCSIMETVHPFGQGYFICMLMYSAYYKYALAGCITGWMSLYPAVPLSAIMTALGSYGILELAKRYFKVDSNRLLKVCYVLLSILGVLLFNLSGRYFAVLGIFEGLTAIASLFIYDKAVKAIFVHKKRSRLTDDEAICVVFCLCTLVIFTGGFKLWAFEVSGILAGVLTIGFGYIFSGTVGAATGVLCGLCVSLGGGSIYAIGSMGVCGFCSGLVRKYGRVASVMAYIAANMALTMYINGSSFVILPIYNTLVSGAIILFIPKKVMDNISQLLCNTLNKSKEERYYVEKYNRLAREKLEKIAALFKTMAELFSESTVRERPEAVVATIVKSAADEVCGKCIWQQKCWEEEFLDTYNAFEKVAENVMLNKQQTGVTKMCVNEAGVIGAISRYAAEAQKKSCKANDKATGNLLLGNQFQGISALLYGMNGDIKNDVRFESDIEKNIRDELQLMDMGVYDVCVMNIGGAYRCEVVTSSAGASMEMRNRVTASVSKFCGKPMVLTDFSGGGKNTRCTFKLVAEKPLRVNTFMAQTAKDSICGDSYKVGYISDNKYMLCISDGMGSGKAAKEESDACVNLLYSFFRAGFEDSIIFQAVNKLLMLRSNTEIFTTADICVVDVVRSKATFTKIGAVPSVLIKQWDVYSINGDSLPLGILENINERSLDIDIEDGDILIMFTDGVYDELTANDEPIEKVIGEIAGKNKDIRKITSDIMERCKIHGEKKDDMTILISMFKKEKTG